MSDYIAIIHKEAGSDYGVSFPDFPGCVTAGKTMDEAKDMAVEALAFHIQGMAEDGEGMPAPSSLDAIMASSDFSDGFAFIVPAPVKEKAIRVQVTLYPSVLAQIDATATERHMSRSAFLANAALKAIHNNSHN